jgi:hypothetical protein
MALIRLPRKPPVKLHQTDQPPIIVKGWTITSFYDENDEWYERAQRKRNGRTQTKWWRLD